MFIINIYLFTLWEEERRSEDCIASFCLSDVFESSSLLEIGRKEGGKARQVFRQKNDFTWHKKGLLGEWKSIFVIMSTCAFPGIKLERPIEEGIITATTTGSCKKRARNNNRIVDERSMA
jgi:hypothetical protein